MIKIYYFLGNFLTVIWYDNAKNLYEEFRKPHQNSYFLRCKNKSVTVITAENAIGNKTSNSDYFFSFISLGKNMCLSLSIYWLSSRVVWPIVQPV